MLGDSELCGTSFRDKYDHLAIIYNKFKYGYKNENFIVWRVGK